MNNLVQGRLGAMMGMTVLLAATPAVADPFVTTVIEYVEGFGVPTDLISGAPYNDPDAALGAPTVDTTGDGWDIPLGGPVPVVPVFPAHRSFEIVSIGLGGQLTLRFDDPVENDPRNPYGVDFIVFGNAFAALDWLHAWTNGDPSGTVIETVAGSIDPGAVSVSQDGTVWHTFSDSIGPHADPDGPYAGTDGPFADVFAPTLGRAFEPDDPDPTLGSWNLWWGGATDPTLPLDPRLSWSDLQGRTLAEVAELYGRSAGGTGFDLDWLGVPGLDWIRYVRIEGPAEGATPEVDAVADVFPHLGDLDLDGDVDLADYAGLQVCFGGAGADNPDPDCFGADFDRDLREHDLDIDQNDAAAFVGVLTGPI